MLISSLIFLRAESGLSAPQERAPEDPVAKAKREMAAASAAEQPMINSMEGRGINSSATDLESAPAASHAVMQGEAGGRTPLDVKPRNRMTAKSLAPSGPPPTLVHVPPKADKLPYPGQNITLTVRVTNTKQTDGKMSLVLVRDGRLAPVESHSAYLNEYDQPTYDIMIPAPIGEMTYQFVVTLSNGAIANSSRYVVRRQCIPNIDLAEAEISPDLQGYPRLEKLISESANLKNDLSSYERVMSLLEELQKRVQK